MIEIVYIREQISTKRRRIPWCPCEANRRQSRACVEHRKPNWRSRKRAWKEQFWESQPLLLLR